MSILTEEVVKLLLAIVVGGLIGAEREFRHRAAGLRTIILICMGSTLFTMFSLELGGSVSPVRIAAHMVTGVGFLCAGVVMEQRTHIVGLTTASTIWFTAAMGMGIGGGPIPDRAAGTGRCHVGFMDVPLVRGMDLPSAGAPHLRDGVPHQARPA